jgi:DNA-binding response OmpR family regulator
VPTALLVRNVMNTEGICPRVLIVDDDLDACSFYKLSLEKTEIHATVYDDPLKALSEFKPDYYDLLMIDIRMPKMNGFKLCMKIKKIDLKAKVCFITAFEEYYDYLKEQFPRLDAQCFIKKPVTGQELVQRIMSELTSKD